MVEIPLYGLSYHETRQSSYRGEDVESGLPVEDTPLLHRFPGSHVAGRNPLTTITVAALLTILVLGVVIGLYLLIVLNNSENLLPPVDTPLQLVSRSQWDPSAGRSLALAPVYASQVIIVQTDTDECHSTETCTSLLKKLQANSTLSHGQLPYSFLVSTNGQTYEALGWREPSPMYPHYAGTLVLAFIGNFTSIHPSQEQLDEAENFFAESVSRLHLTPHFDIIGKNTMYKPELLFDALRSLPQWSEQQSDA